MPTRPTPPPGRSSPLCLILIIALIGWNAIQPQTVSAAPAAGQRLLSLRLDRATPQQAFDALGQTGGCRFDLADGEQWVEQGVPVTTTLENVTFWQAFRALSDQTGYEPVYQPTRSGAAITLRRVDVRAEQSPAAAEASGPLLVRPRRAFLSRPPAQARLTLVPVQVAVEVELFVEPGVDALYVSAAALRASDGDGKDLARADDLDPLAGLADGIGLVRLNFDAPAGQPAAVGSWQALLRVGLAEGRDPLRLPLSMPATRPTTREAEIGGLRVLLDPPQFSADAETKQQTLGVTLTLPRGNTDASTWRQAYNAVATTPPSLEEPGENTGGPWRRTSYAVWALSSPTRPAEAGTYRIFARFARDTEKPQSELPPGTTLAWPLPKSTIEHRELVRLSRPLPIEPPHIRE